MTNAKQKDKKGFTLIELSIVLVIVGLLVGGVLVGQDLIEAAKLRSITSDSTKYQTAINTFRLKYNALPGDMPNATAFWGAVVGSCTTVAGTGTQTCNGDNDKKFDYTISYFSNSLHEPWRAWQHLSNAGLIEGNYTGISGICGFTNNCPIPGVNAPATSFDGVNFNIFYIFYPLLTDWGGKPEARNVFAIGNPSNNAGRWFGPAFTPSQAYSIDAKIDDGKPFTGIVTNMSTTVTNTDCATANSDDYSTPTADYKISYTSPACDID